MGGEQGGEMTVFKHRDRFSQLAWQTGDGDEQMRQPAVSWLRYG
jgi:hypothetical protein